MDIVFLGVTAQAADYGEHDKLIKVITANGVRRCLLKGVKKPSAKLKAVAMPLAFYEFTAFSRGKDSLLVVTNASQVEDLFKIALDPSKHLAAFLMLEASLFCFGETSEDFFVYLLHRLKDVMYGACSPFLTAIRFFQYIIHSSGYNYDYPDFNGNPASALELLSLLSRLNHTQPVMINAPEGLIMATLKKIVANFESKFECELNSKKLI